ncbi:MAG: thiol:disulfide interchange protein DsbA/DsbL [Burkholderiaceae bacterium]|nr:thiol:disulfide interchange protein DsbA/DsbL [Sulfuritalea sp.]MCF8176197.1 thiol:disulfide interchange protein DsbA/DsbL [Burkholderiaceae bacterium]MCF8183549.1 thiol:disulfide interchange protein DsbA/DsbL [Polynucleobacter sp.]
MNPWRALLATFLTLACLSLGFAAGAAELKQGKDYLLINPPLTADNTRIEVTEFFWYGCPHCFDFEPALASWLKKLPGDVSFRRVPAIFPNNQWTPGASLYYSLEAMDLLDALHDEVFKAIHVERKRLDNEMVLLEWLSGKGVDAQKFSATRASFGVQSRVQQARRLTLASGMNGVPALMVHGQFLVPTQGPHAELLATVDQLIERVRAVHRGKPGANAR